MNKNESKYFNTSKKMNDALISLLEHKDFEYITIKDICQKANVNRSTFYLHYSNLNDLLEEVIENTTLSFHLHLNNNGTETSIIHQQNLDDLLLIKDKFLIPYLEFIKENKNVYKAIKHHPQLFHANRTYEAMFTSVFSPIMERFGLEKKWHKYMMDFYMNGISSILLDWVFDNCQISIQEMSNFIKGIIINYENNKLD